MELRVDRDQVLRISAPEGLRYAVLFPYIEGRQLSKSPDPEKAKLAGNTLARLQLFADRFPWELHRPTIDYDLLVVQSLGLFQEVVRHRKVDVDANLLEGYQKVRPLGSDELSAISLLEADRDIFSLGIPAKNINTWGSAYQNERMIDIRIRNIKKKMADKA